MLQTPMRAEGEPVQERTRRWVMGKESGYRAVPFTMNRKMVAASASVGRERNNIHGIMEVDITEPRRGAAAQERRTRRTLGYSLVTAHSGVPVAHIHPRCVPQRPHDETLRGNRRHGCGHVRRGSALVRTAKRGNSCGCGGQHR